MDVHLRDLRAFLTVADELHFTRAADRLYVSQPALSRQIQVLERTLRVRLFVRGRRSQVTLTPAGEALLPHARRSVAAWDEGRQGVAASLASGERRFTVELSIAIGRGLLPAAIECFTARHPRYVVDLRQTPFDRPTDGVLDGTADAAFCWLPLAPHPELAHTVLFTEDLMLALPLGHRLTSRDAVDITEVLDEPVLALPASTGPLRDFWIAADHRERPATIGAVVNGPEEAVEALAQGRGVALISAGNARLYPRAEFEVRPLTGVGPCHLAVVWNRELGGDAVDDFVECCRRSASSADGGLTPDVVAG